LAVKTLAAVGLALLSGCVMPHNKAATASYVRDVAVAQERSATLERAVAEYEGRLARLEEAMRAAGAHEAEKLENLDQVNAEVNRLRGQSEVLRFELDELKRTFEGLSVDVDRRQLYDELRLRQLEQFLGVKPPPMPAEEPVCDPTVEACEDGDQGTEGSPPPPGAAPPTGEPETAAAALEQAVAHLEGDRPRVARAILEKAVQTYHGAPELAEIRYRLGETWMNEGKWSKAVTAFQAVVDNHSSSEWAAWAMLRQGDCFIGMGQNDNGRLFYEEVQRLHPSSEAAGEAKKLLGGG